MLADVSVFLTPAGGLVRVPASLPEDSCVARLRRSVSDPTDLQSRTRRLSAAEGLNRCLSACSLLAERVEKVSGLIRNMPGVCKKCHGQTGSDHAGSRWGFEHCSLLHSDYCLGGITEIPGVRTACPEGFVTKSVESGNDTDISQQRFSDLEDDSDADPDYVPTKDDIKDFVRETKSSTASASSVSFVSSAPVTHSLASVLNTSTTVFAAGNSGFVSTPLSHIWVRRSSDGPWDWLCSSTRTAEYQLCRCTSS